MNNPAAAISIIICAYTEERWETIVEAIASLHAQTRVPDEIILVVDHNPSLFERARQAFPAVLVVENKHMRGLSGARNSGIDMARGGLIGFLDDDAVAAPDWLELLAAACVDANVLGAGGWVEPRWSGTPPRWFPQEFFWTVGCSYRGQPETRTEVRNPFGGCMIVRREVFTLVGGFANGIGRVGKRPVGCEETELCIRASEQEPGRRWMFEPRARIAHCVSSERTTWRYFRARCYAEGLSKAQVAHHTNANAALHTERVYTLHTLPRGLVRGLRDTLRGDASGLLRAGAIAIGLATTIAGYVVGVAEQQRAQRTPYAKDTLCSN
jgi:GT2 family glycosyltransferase